MAFMVSICLHYCGCDAEIIFSALEMCGMDDFIDSIPQRLKDDRTVERLEEQNSGNGGEIVRTMSLEGIETTVTVRYVLDCPMEMKLQCRELRNFTSRKPLVGVTPDGRDYSMSISSGILECHTQFIGEEEGSQSSDESDESDESDS